MANIKRSVDELHKCFHKLNDSFFNGELPEPAIVILPQGKHKNTLGWCTLQEVWRSKDEKEKRYEISICAEYLDRDILQIAGTMLHEMVHLNNIIHGVKDTSRGLTYHNKTYRKTAEEHGLEVAYDKKIGWSVTRLSEAAEDTVRSFNLDPEAFKIARVPEYDGNGKGTGKDAGKGQRKTSSRKYVCRSCGIIVRATKDVNIACMDCKVVMVKEEQDQEEPEDSED